MIDAPDVSSPGFRSGLVPLPCATEPFLLQSYIRILLGCHLKDTEIQLEAFKSVALPLGLTQSKTEGAIKKMVTIFAQRLTVNVIA